MLNKLLQKLGKDTYQPLNKIIISQNQLTKNYQILQNVKAGVSIAPVLKSNAYGHGLSQISTAVGAENPPFICVDSLPEANILKKLGTNSSVLIMGSISRESLSTQLPFQLTIINKESLMNFSDLQQNAMVHLFIDTGMNREGVKLSELDEVLILLKKTKLNLVGLMTHLAIANDKNDPLTKKQIENFQIAKQKVGDAGLSPRWIHIGGSDAISWMEPEIATIVRCGRLLFGVQSTELKELSPIMKVQSTIVQLKEVKRGESVGYFATFKAQKDLKTAVLPIGYNDGVDKRLSNLGVVQISGLECPIIGLISMNMMVVDVTTVKDLKVGDKAIIFSDQPQDKNSIEQSAVLIKTNPSDLLVGLHPSTRREIVG